MEFTHPETDFLTDSYSLENGGFRKWRGFGRTKNPPFSRFYCIKRSLEMKNEDYKTYLIIYMIKVNVVRNRYRKSVDDRLKK